MSELEDEDETSGFMSCSWLPGIFEENEAIKLKSLLNLREGPFEDGGPTERSKRGKRMENERGGKEEMH